jgi:hypothetical protein
VTAIRPEEAAIQLCRLAHVREFLRFLQEEELLDPGELISHRELLRAREQCFDRALHFAGVGYESGS